MPVGAGLCRSVPVATGRDRCRPVPTGADWCRPVPTGADRCRLVPVPTEIAERSQETLYDELNKSHELNNPALIQTFHLIANYPLKKISNLNKKYP